MQTQWQQAMVAAHGVDFHYTRTGAGTGKPVIVLAHGFSDYGLNWGPLVPHFEADYDFILPDARGHGLSARAVPGEEIDLAGDLAAVMQALGIENAIVGGHSMGGYTAGALAQRFPHLTRALILEDPAWFDRPAEPEPKPQPEDKPNPWHEWLFSLPGTPIESVMAKCRADNPSWGDEELRPWAESKMQFDPNFLKVPQTFRGDWRDTVRSLKAPTLLLTADKEKGAIISPEMAEEIRGLSPYVVVAAIPNAGHSIRRENGPAYIQAVRAFLKKIG